VSTVLSLHTKFVVDVLKHDVHAAAVEISVPAYTCQMRKSSITGSSNILLWVKCLIINNLLIAIISNFIIDILS